eukprot:TRINITY_DN25_c0_g1_i1.p1 TRINITY_DN25_c0_g1~~TRINITY_DN25_c0_g1_i1.p1  ORF type:complete len:314 (-),score=31.68 TRINITY_DN25_c0_g1_i1:87-1028(-)
MIFDVLIYDYILDTRWYWGPNPTWTQNEIIRMAGLFIVGFVWFFALSISYIVVEQLSYKFFPKYSKMNKIEKTDWSSRIIATIVIALTGILTILIKAAFDENTIVLASGDGTSIHNSEWRIYTEVSDGQFYLLYHIYALLLGYEMYDLKNCIHLKMTSGVIHHVVLIFMFPMVWTVPSLCIPGVVMSQLSYLSNIPAHIRSFLAHTGHRDTALYRWNRWAWWVAYVVFRLFGIPFYSGQMWYAFPVMKAQTTMFCIVAYFTAMVIHYSLSMYWFVNMSRTMFPPKDYDLRKIESFDQLPKPSPTPERGGQKFD